MLFQDNFYTPIGNLQLRATATVLTSISFTTEIINPIPNEIINKTKLELTAYFEGKLENFTIPLNPSGTDFQQKVWQLLLKVPFGTTKTYGQQAMAYGNLKAIRAVAAANGKNPIAIIIPCHRIIGSNGTLTGYAGGLEKKKWLLDFEQKNKPTILTLFNDYVSE